MEFQSLLQGLAALTERYRFNFGDESQMQEQFASMLSTEGIPFSREWRIGSKDRPDFRIGSIAIELKISASIEAHLRQLKRYADCPAVTGVILIGTRPFVLPKTLSDKPCACIAISRL